MLTIRAAQMVKLGRWSRRQRLTEWLPQLRSQFPDESACLSDEALLTSMEACADRAAGYGVETAQDLYRFLSLGLCVGWNFDVEQPWAGRMLTDGDVISPSQRVRNVFGECIRRLEMEAHNRKLRQDFDPAEAS